MLEEWFFLQKLIIIPGVWEPLYKKMLSKLCMLEFNNINAAEVNMLFSHLKFLNVSKWASILN